MRPLVGRLPLATTNGEEAPEPVFPLHADSDDAAMSFRDHAAIYSGLIPPPCVGLFDGLVLG
jgi:hypothetical protein